MDGGRAGRRGLVSMTLSLNPVVNAIAFAALLSMLGESAWSQQATATVTQQAVYAGEPFQVRVVATGFPEDPEPTSEYIGAPNDRIRIELGDVSRQQSMFLHSADGKVTRSTEYRYVYSYQVVVADPGDFELGRFKVSARDAVAETRPLSLTCKPVEVDSDWFIDISLEREKNRIDQPPEDSFRIYVGEHVPVSLTWGIAGDLLELDNVNIACPLFDEFLFRDPPSSALQVSRSEPILLRISGKQGVLEIPATVNRQERGGERVQAVTSKRILVPNKPGEFDISPATISARKVNRRRGILRDPFFPNPFGARDSVENRPVRAQSTPLRIRVLPIPTEGRPAAFAGAVGDSFAIEVAAKRSVVRVGEPIDLTISLKGGTGLDTASLPPLSAQVGFNANEFSYDATPAAGTWNAETNEKSFTVTIRPLRETIREIPSLQFAWFNPKTEAFQTAQSNPISLQVQPTQLVTARDAISSVKLTPADTEVDPRLPKPAAEKLAPEMEGEQRLGGTQRDLSITVDLERLATDANASKHWLWRGTWILAGISLILSGWFRFHVDSKNQRAKRRALHRLGRAWDEAAGPGMNRSSAMQLAKILWDARVHASDEQLAPLNQQIRDLELIAYAPPHTSIVRDRSAFEKPSLLCKTGKLSK